MLLGVILVVATFNLVGADRGRAIRQTFGTDNSATRQYGTAREVRPLEGMDFGNL